MDALGNIPGVTRPAAFVPGDESPGTAMFAHGNTRVVEKVMCAWEDRRQVVADLLGYPKFGNGSLGRKMPVKHPYWDWCFAKEVSDVRGLGPKSAANGNISTTNGLTDYHRAEMMVVFDALPYKVATNQGDQPDESYRHVTIETDVVSEFLTYRTDKQFIFTEGGAGVEGEKVKIEPGRQLCRIKYSMTWWHVPERSLFSGYVPTNVVAVLGKTNSVAWGLEGNASFPAETLLVEGVQLRRVPAGVNAFEVNGQKDGTNAMYDVTYSITYNPLGVNKFPYGTAGNFYKAQLGGAGGATLYQAVPYATYLFKPL